MLTHCSKEEKLALAEAAFGGGYLEPVVFEGKYSARCPQAVLSSSREKIPSLFGLLMRRNDYGELWLAGGIEAKLQSLLPEPKAVAVKKLEGNLPETYEEKPVRTYEGESIVFQELRRVLGLAQAGKLAITAKGNTPTGACVRRIGEALIQPDLEVDESEAERGNYYEEAGAVRAFAWGVVVQQCGWCKPAGTKLSITAKGRAMLAGGSADALKTGFERLLKDDSFEELNRINNIRGQTGKGKRSMTRPSSRKPGIADSMAEWPVNEWIAFESVLQFLKASGNSFNVSRNNWDLYFCEKQYGSLGYDHGDDGYGIERQYMRAFFMEILATLGIVDIAYVSPHWLWPEFKGSWGTDDMAFCGRYDGLLHLRLTRLGAYCLGNASAYEMPENDSTGLVKVLPNLELVLMNDCSPADIARLELFASPGNERVWKFDQKRILAHLETGGSMDEIRKEISSVADGEIPGTVTTLLDEIENKATALKGGKPCILIEVRDKATAALIAHDSGASKYCLPAGDKHLVVLKKNERAFRNALKKLGYVLPQ